MRSAAPWWAAATVLLGVFACSRVLLVTAAYDAVANWEEPVFLFSAQAIRHDGIATIFDHQDDLSHGGSLPLLLMARAWIPLFGARLDVLKGIAVLWSAVTLLAILLVSRRFVSGHYALVVACRKNKRRFPFPRRVGMRSMQRSCTPERRVRYPSTGTVQDSV